MTTPSPRSLAPLLAGLVALAACGGPSGAPATAPDPKAPASTGATSTTEAPPAARAPRVGAPRPEHPVAITLPDGATLPVRGVSTTANGVLDVPPDVRKAGWWRGGSRLGDPFGSTLIAAHVDSVSQGLGAFASLLQVERGDRVRLRSRHLRQVFVVESLRLVPRPSFGERPGLRSAQGPRRLVLVTCAPPYDAARGGYQNLAVVTATPASGPAGRAERGAR